MSERHYTILEIVHNADDPTRSTMEVLFYENGDTLRYNLWLPDDPTKVDAEIKARWPVADFGTKRAAAANVKAKIDQYKTLVSVKTAVTSDVGVPTVAQPQNPRGLGVQRPATK